jgi:hypothetical protein
MACLLIARNVKSAETAVARERLCRKDRVKQWLKNRHVMAATDTHLTIEKLLEAVFSVQSAPSSYNEDRL